MCSIFFKRGQKSGFACEIFQFLNKRVLATQTTSAGPLQPSSPWSATYGFQAL